MTNLGKLWIIDEQLLRFRPSRFVRDSRHGIKNVFQRFDVLLSQNASVFFLFLLQEEQHVLVYVLSIVFLRIVWRRNVK